MNATKDDERALREAMAAALEGVGKDTGAAIAALRRRAKSQRRIIRALFVMTAIMVLTIAGLTIQGVAIKHTVDSVDTVQERTSNAVLCPLYGAFLAAKDNPVPDNIKNDPAQIAERNRAFAIIEAGWAELGCGERP